jgi:beta-glucanase (GH16 family)
MPKISSLAARVSLLISLLAVMLLGAGANVALAAAHSKIHSRKTPKHHVTHARKHRKHSVRRVASRNTVLTATAAKAAASASGLSACTTTSASAGVQPEGSTGSWTLAFDDEFNGSSVNRTSWSTDNGYINQNNVTDSSSNISVVDGCAVLRLASARSGAEMTTNTVGLKVGEWAEARIQFAGNGTTVDNWPAFWAAGPGWPASGEQDIFEGLGNATVNYHYAVRGNNTQAGPFNITGDWAASFHTYGIYRGSNYCYVYWDGKLVKTYPTDDNGGLEYLLLTEGAANSLSFGASGHMLVDYVRVWKQS